MRSHLGELAHLTGPAHLHMNSPLVKEYKYWKESTNTANIVLLSANQIADISDLQVLVN